MFQTNTPGIGAPEAATIVRFRSEHGPITDAAALARVPGNRPLADGLDARADFAPADSTAPEAPGAWPESRAPRSFRVTVYSCAGRRTSCAR